LGRALIGAYGNPWVDLEHADELVAFCRINEISIQDGLRLKELMGLKFISEVTQELKTGIKENGPFLNNNTQFYAHLTFIRHLIDSIVFAHKTSSLLAFSSGIALMEEMISKEGHSYIYWDTLRSTDPIYLGNFIKGLDIFIRKFSWMGYSDQNCKVLDVIIGVFFSEFKLEKSQFSCKLIERCNIEAFSRLIKVLSWMSSCAKPEWLDAIYEYVVSHNKGNIINCLEFIEGFLCNERDSNLMFSLSTDADVIRAMAADVITVKDVKNVKTVQERDALVIKAKEHAEQNPRPTKKAWA